jgi:hypothetical protein
MVVPSNLRTKLSSYSCRPLTPRVCGVITSWRYSVFGVIQSPRLTEISCSIAFSSDAKKKGTYCDHRKRHATDLPQAVRP